MKILNTLDGWCNSGGTISREQAVELRKLIETHCEFDPDEQLRKATDIIINEASRDYSQVDIDIFKDIIRVLEYIQGKI